MGKTTNMKKNKQALVVLEGKEGKVDLPSWYTVNFLSSTVKLWIVKIIHPLMQAQTLPTLKA